MPETLSQALEGWRPALDARVDDSLRTPRVEEVGRVQELGDGIARLTGLPSARLDELLMMPGDTPALAVELSEDYIGCLLLGEYGHVRAGDSVRGTGQVLRIPVGEGLLGRVVDPLGNPLDEAGPVMAERHEPAERPAPPIIDRAPVSEPLYTGLTVVDAMFPIGRGQRELIIGDRASGKTALAVDAMIRQRDSGVICVYVAVGQKSSGVKQVIEAIRAQGSMERAIFIVAEAEAPPGLQWLAPYAAFTMAEFFRDRGQDALVVVDDLSQHAAAYREISLLLRRPPGREAYPGDIFYIHSRLLERAAKLSPERGGGSLTALPVAETQAENLSAYIPTNLISITDGQIYLSARLFGEGQKPAVDVGRSVSRVGGKAQAPALREVAGRLRLEYAQFLELEVFTRFGAMTDERTRRAIEHGRRIRAILNQPRFAVLSSGEEVALLLAASAGDLADLPPERAAQFRKRLPKRLKEQAAWAIAAVEETGKLEDNARQALRGAVRDLVDELTRKADGGTAERT